MKFFCMKFLLMLSFSILSVSVFSQYYYNDIIANNQTNSLYQLLKTNKIANIKAVTVDDQDKQIEGFSVNQEFTPDYRKLSTHSSISDKDANTFTAIYSNNRILRTSTISTGIETKTEYFYDEGGRLQKIISSSTDTAFKTHASEMHLWLYNKNGKPENMIKIKNNTDTIKIELINDENGNTIEERWKKNGLTLETYYYYYNDKNLLTDIVRFNKRVQQLLPDFIFEYDDERRIKQMTQVPAANSNYITWKYHYSDKGLKTEDICENKQKQLIGKVIYSYR